MSFYVDCEWQMTIGDLDLQFKQRTEVTCIPVQRAKHNAKKSLSTYPICPSTVALVTPGMRTAGLNAVTEDKTCLVAP